MQVFKLQGFMAQERLPVDKTISPEPFSFILGNRFLSYN